MLDDALGWFCPFPPRRGASVFWECEMYEQFYMRGGGGIRGDGAGYCDGKGDPFV